MRIERDSSTTATAGSVHAIRPRGRRDRPLRIALLAYRGNPYSGGQGVYVRMVSRALARMGHSVEVFAGPPYPVVDGGITLTRLPSLDLYREADPFRRPALAEFRDGVDVLEYGLMCTAGFPEPLTFSLRAWRALRARAADFDIVHDNQCLGYGLLGIARAGLPVVATMHHPITVDRDLELAAAATWRRRLSVRRWYGFTRMQKRVARRLPRIITVSAVSRADIARRFGLDPDAVAVVPNGVDAEVFGPEDEVPRVAGRIVTTASADVPLKGLAVLVEAMAEVRTQRPDAELVVVGTARRSGAAGRAVDALADRSAVRFVSGLSDADLARLYAQAEVAVVPSLYEGFSLPAVEAMACGVPVVASRAGALPEVVGEDGATGLLVPPGDAAAMARVIVALLDDPALRRRIGGAGRERVLRRFTWESSAAATVEQYHAALRAC